MVSKGSYIILLVIVAVLTLTLAVLAGYLFTLSGASEANSENHNNTTGITRPDDDKLGYLSLFSENNFFNLKNEDSQSIIQLSAQLGYRKSVKGIKNVENKVNFNLAKIKEITGTYFQSLTYEEVIMSDAKEKANKELTKLINDFLLSNERYKEEIIYEVIFDKWFYQQ